MRLCCCCRRCRCRCCRRGRRGRRSRGPGGRCSRILADVARTLVPGDGDSTGAGAHPHPAGTCNIRGAVGWYLPSAWSVDSPKERPTFEFRFPEGGDEVDGPSGECPAPAAAHAVRRWFHGSVGCTRSVAGSLVHSAAFPLPGRFARESARFLPHSLPRWRHGSTAMVSPRRAPRTEARMPYSKSFRLNLSIPPWPSCPRPEAKQEDASPSPDMAVQGARVCGFKASHPAS